MPLQSLENPIMKISRFQSDKLHSSISFSSQPMFRPTKRCHLVRTQSFRGVPLEILSERRRPCRYKSQQGSKFCLNLMSFYSSSPPNETSSKLAWSWKCFSMFFPPFFHFFRPPLHKFPFSCLFVIAFFMCKSSQCDKAKRKAQLLHPFLFKFMKANAESRLPVLPAAVHTHHKKVIKILMKKFHSTS